jgi:hypothetical protein
MSPPKKHDDIRFLRYVQKYFLVIIHGVAARQSGKNAIPGIFTPDLLAVFGGGIG